MKKIYISYAHASVAVLLSLISGIYICQICHKTSEKTEFNIVLKSGGPAKLKVIKEVKNLLGLGLKEAKKLVDNAPINIKENISKAEAEFIKSKLEGVGAEVEINYCSNTSSLLYVTKKNLHVTEKTEFDVLLKSAGTAKLKVVREVKNLLGLGLKESQELVDSAPGNIKEGISEDEAKSIKAALEEAGAEVKIIELK